MTEYPEKTCEIDRLIRHPKLVEAALAGRKNQQRRDGLYAYPGETFKLEGVTFKVTAVTRQLLGEMTDEDARAEGYPNMAFYRDLILKMHAGMTWHEDHPVWVHHFSRVEEQ